MELPEDLLTALPRGFAAVGEALVSGAGGAVDACAVTGRELALEGVSLDEALHGLEKTCRLVRRAPPDFADVRALSLGWSETTLGYLHRLTCADPVTGLASLAHLQGRLTELYRAGPGAHPDYALVVLDTARPILLADPVDPADVLVADLRVARCAETARAVFAGDEVVGRLDRYRIAVLTARDPLLGRRVAVLRRLVATADGGPRIWIEGLPRTESAARAALGELVRR